MPLITITGVITNSKGEFPDEGGVVNFLLNQPFTAADGRIVTPKMEAAEVDDADGTFSIDLESTRDGVPASSFYRAMFRGEYGGAPVNIDLGRIQLRSTPSSQDLDDLLADTLLTLSSDRRIIETPEGTIDGNNCDFYLSRAPIAGSDLLFQNGLLVRKTYGYTISENHIVYVLPPLIGDWHRVEFVPA